MSPIHTLDITSTESIPEFESSKLATPLLLLPANKPLPQWQQISDKFLTFLEQFPKYLGRFSTEYKQLIIVIASMIAAIITAKLVLAVLDAINDLLWVNQVFELTGIGYVTWFVFRYLLKASTRQELAAQISFIQKEIVEGEVP